MPVGAAAPRQGIKTSPKCQRESTAETLSESRKFALTLTIGHQYLEQLPDDLRAAVFGNVGSIVACRIGATDAAMVGEQIGLAAGSVLLIEFPDTKKTDGPTPSPAAMRVRPWVGVGDAGLRGTFQ